MDEDVRDNEQDDEKEPRQPAQKPGVETWPVVPGGKPGTNQTGNEEQ